MEGKKRKILEDLAKKDTWEIGAYRFRIDKLHMREGLGVLRRLARILGPSLSALAGGQVETTGAAGRLVKDYADRALKGDKADVKKIRSELEQGLSGDLAAELASIIGKAFGEALDRFVYAVGDKEGEDDLWFILDAYIGSTWVSRNGKAEKKLEQISEAIFTGRWDLVFRFMGASTVRNFGTFLADLGLIDLLREVGVPGLDTSSLNGSTKETIPSHIASPHPASTPTVSPISSTAGP